MNKFIRAKYEVTTSRILRKNAKPKFPVLRNLLGFARITPKAMFHVKHDGPTRAEVFATVVTFAGFGFALYAMLCYPA